MRRSTMMIMTNVYLIGLSGLMKTLLLFSLAKVSLGLSFLLWQQLFFPSGLLRYCRTRQTVPYLLLELRMRLNMRYWVVRLSKLALRSCDCHGFLASSARHDYLPYRYGRQIFDFFKTLSLTDVSPPAVA